MVGAIWPCDICDGRFWVVSLTPEGQVAWHLALNALGNVGGHAHTVVQKPGGDYVVSGEGGSFRGTGATLWLAQISSDGASWQIKSYEVASGRLGGYSTLRQTHDGGYAVAVVTGGYVRLLKLTTDLEPILARRYDAYVFHRPSMAETSDGGFLVTVLGSAPYEIPSNFTYLMRVAADGSIPQGRYTATEETVLVASGDPGAASIPLYAEPPNLQPMNLTLSAMDPSLTEVIFNPRP